MANMRQAKTDFGTRGETGEREPKGAKSSDSTGTKSRAIKNGVGMGAADGTGERSGGGKERGEYNTGRSESVCYSHQRIPHDQD